MEVDKPKENENTLEISYPTQLSSSAKTQFLELDESRLFVRYTGKANAPLENDMDIAYFEVHILRAETGSKMSIGLASENFVLDDLPGSQTQSYGYFSGGEFWVYGRRRSVDLPSYSTGNIIGCGFNHVTSQIFFTCDGTVVKTESISLRGNEQFPCIGLHHPSQRVHLNFGQMDFCFNISEKRAELRAQQMSQIDAQPLPSLSRVVYNYLLFHGYKDTAQAFEASNPSELKPLTMRDTMLLSTLDLRAELRHLILRAGEYQQAKNLLLSHYGDIAGTSEALFELDCVIFVDLVTQKKISEAVEMSQTTFANWWSPSTFERIEDCCSLLAFFTPEDSPVAYLTSQAHLTQVAKLINRSILQWTALNTNSVTTGQELEYHEDEPDLYVLLTHLERIHDKIRTHRRAGVPFSLSYYEPDPPETTPNAAGTGLTASTASLRTSTSSTGLRKSGK